VRSEQWVGWSCIKVLDADAVEALCEAGWLEATATHLRPTRTGLAVVDSLMVRVLRARS
jgi:hypothetical protein